MLLAGLFGLFHASLRTAQSINVVTADNSFWAGYFLRGFSFLLPLLFCTVLGISPRHYQQKLTSKPYATLVLSLARSFSSALASGIGKGLVFLIRKFFKSSNTNQRMQII